AAGPYPLPSGQRSGQRPAGTGSGIRTRKKRRKNMHRYIAYNGPMPTTAAQQKVTTGTAIKTMLQLSTPSTRMIQVLSWGYSLDGVPTAGVGQIELIQTDVAATVTAHVASGVQNLDPNG